MFVSHVNLAFDSGDTENQRRVCNFATKFSQQAETKGNDKKTKASDKKSKKQKGAETRE